MHGNGQGMHLIKECKSQSDEVCTIFRMLKTLFSLNYKNISGSFDCVCFSQLIFSFYIAAASKCSAKFQRTGG